MGKLVRALGLMSGTSMDGIDVALIETDGEADCRRLAAASTPYPPEFRVRLREALAAARVLEDRQERPAPLAAAEAELTRLHGEAVARFLRARGLTAGDVGVIGFHGQTVLHRPERGLTVQIGDGAALAGLTGVDVVYDLRAADVAAGGQGAPLVPVYHRALVARLPQRPVAVLNVGGVANVTFVGRDDRLIAFDTGPGNALIDDLMATALGQTCDKDGALAGSGTVDQAALAAYLAHDYFAAPPPKSLDRDAFSLAGVAGLPPADAAATLTAFTAAAVARARACLPEEPQLWIVTGGGRRNRTLMRLLAAHVENAVAPAEAVGLDGDAMEAEAWAYLAVRALGGLALTFPGTTGVPQPTSGGVLARAPGRSASV
ncbi:MAG: anhydro-N-acetylmuramic acid kinase [Hyphomicrobiaceae bacterium]